MNVFHNKLKPIKWPKEIHLAKEFDTTIFPESQHEGITKTLKQFWPWKAKYILNAGFLSSSFYFISLES